MPIHHLQHPSEQLLTCVKLKSDLMASGMRGGKANQLLQRVSRVSGVFVDG